MAVKRKKPLRRTMQTTPNLFDVAREKELLGSNLTVQRWVRQTGMSVFRAAALAELYGLNIEGGARD
jgi:hypothetical protein